MSNFLGQVSDPPPPEPTFGERFSAFRTHRKRRRKILKRKKALREAQRLVRVAKQEEEYQAKMAKQAEEYQAKMAIEAQKARKFLEQWHADFIALLSDDFNQLRVYLYPFLKARPNSETSFLVNRFCGQVQGVSIGGSGAQNAQNILGDMSTNFKQGALRSALYDPYYHACRTVADLHEREIAVLKLLALFVLEGEIERDVLDKYMRIIVVNGGKCTVFRGGEDGGFSEPKGKNDQVALAAVQEWISKLHQPAALAVNDAIALIGNIRKTSENQAVLDAIEEHLVPGNRWKDVG